MNWKNTLSGKQIELEGFDEAVEKLISIQLDDNIPDGNWSSKTSGNVLLLAEDFAGNAYSPYFGSNSGLAVVAVALGERHDQVIPCSLDTAVSPVSCVVAH